LAKKDKNEAAYVPGLPSCVWWSPIVTKINNKFT